MLTKNELELVENVKKQFLCNVPIKNIHWNKDILNNNLPIQELIIDETVRLNLILKRPVKINYQKAFIKFIIEHLEAQESSIHELLYEEYARLVALPYRNDENHIFKHYLVCGKVLSLKENPNLISQGTTGLRTWQAALALSEWIIQNPDKFSDKIVLELGSGVGLTGLTLKSLKIPTKSVIFSDCHPAVLSTLSDNIKLNIDKVIPIRLVDDDFNHQESTHILNLPWEEISENVCLKLGRIHKIIAADIVYDSELFAPLISAVTNLFKYCQVEEFILSCTVRNAQTFQEFKTLIKNTTEHFNCEDLEVPRQVNFVWETESPLKILRITPN